MSLLQRFFDTDFWKQRVKALSRDLNTAYDNLCEVTEKWRSAEKEVSDLKAKLQLAEDDFDEMANLYAGLHKAFDDLVDTNADLKVFSANKLREANLHETANEKLQRDVIDLQNDNANLHRELDKVKTLNSQLDLAKSAYYEFLSNKEALCTKISALELENARYKTVNTPTLTEVMAKNEQLERRISELQNSNADLRENHTRQQLCFAEDVIKELTTKCGALELNYTLLQSEMLTKTKKLETQLSTALKDYDTYKDLATNTHKNNLRLIDKVKAIQEVVKVLEPVSMRFQTALFDLLDDTNVPRT